MRPQEIIAKKRDGEILTRGEINSFVRGITDGTWADYQTAALVMAMFINELSADEQNALTEAMLDSGERLDFSDIAQPKADKHSTGGVGDKTSLIIAPLVAACGVSVPMISGRGLGHTGGTLDKLESIKGYNVNLSTAEFKRIIKECGFAMSGQTAEIAPADKKIYALRDATATVESIPLIVASIMSKKLAENLDALVLDVKTGSGAFMPELSGAKKLAEALCRTGNAFGVKTEAVISDMNQPLGKYVGNALEVYECVKILRGEIDEKMQPTLELSIELAARMLVLCGVAETISDSKSQISNAFGSGAALEKFRQNIELQNGDAKVCDKPESLFDENLIQIEIKAEKTGFVAEINASAIGECVSKIGGGRIKVSDKIDFAVGYECAVKLGDEVKLGETLGVILCRNAAQADSIYEKLANAYKIEDEKSKREFDLIKEIINIKSQFKQAEQAEQN
ncbi:MAG: thymidine phosphorylase [Pyrinomonadaceae bacterium]|nr:thymidine phosphorylase [Pyrinomonadaceae bacterium]